MSPGRNDNDQEQASDEGPGFFLSGPTKPIRRRGRKQDGAQLPPASGPEANSKDDPKRRAAIRREIREAIAEAQPEVDRRIARARERRRSRPKLEPVT